MDLYSAIVTILCGLPGLSPPPMSSFLMLTNLASAPLSTSRPLTSSNTYISPAAIPDPLNAIYLFPRLSVVGTSGTIQWPFQFHFQSHLCLCLTQSPSPYYRMPDPLHTPLLTQHRTKPICPLSTILVSTLRGISSKRIIKYFCLKPSTYNLLPWPLNPFLPTS